MVLPRLLSAGRARSNRRRTFIPETLEDRNLLSAAAVGVTAAQVRPLVQTVQLQGTIGGGVTLGTSRFNSVGNVFVPVSYAGAGSLSNLGFVTISGTHTTEIFASTRYSTSVALGGTAKVTTANGDSFSLTYSGQGQRILGQTNLFRDTFSYTITGGTGRFAGAKGTGVIYSVDLRGGTSTEIPVVLAINGGLTTVSTR